MSLTVCYKLSMQLSRPRPRARPRPEPSSTRPKLRPCRSAKAKAMKWLACMEAPRNQGLVSRTTSLMSWSEFIRLCHVMCAGLTVSTWNLHLASYVASSTLSPTLLQSSISVCVQASPLQSIEQQAPRSKMPVTDGISNMFNPQSTSI